MKSRWNIFLLFSSGVFLLGLGVAVGAFLFSDFNLGSESKINDSEKNKIAGVISETFKDILYLNGDEKPDLEIDLRRPESEIISVEEKRQNENSSSSDVAQKTKTTAGEETGKEEEKKKIYLIADCDFNFASNSSRMVLFNEIAWMGTEANENDEWIELKNISAEEINLSGWQMLSKDGRIKFRFSDVSLKPGEFFLLERTDDESLPNIKADAIYVGLLPNGGSWLGLFDSNCALVDEINASGGWMNFGGDKITKKTLERNSADFGWHTSSIVGGTPRAGNSEPTPVVISTPPGATPLPLPSSQPPPAANIAEKININTAGYEELQRITGVGPVIAQRIIDYRNANGPFRKLEELKEVKGIGDATFEKMRDEIEI